MIWGAGEHEAGRNAGTGQNAPRKNEKEREEDEIQLDSVGKNEGGERKG